VKAGTFTSLFLIYSSAPTEALCLPFYFGLLLMMKRSIGRNQTIRSRNEVAKNRLQLLCYWKPRTVLGDNE